MTEIIKLINNKNEPNEIKCILTQNDNYYIDTSFMNILRKYIISNVSTFCFVYVNREIDNPKIIVENNNSSLNDDMLSHRISLLPINILGLLYIVLLNEDTQEIDNLISLKDNILKNNEIQKLIKNKKKLIEKLQFQIKVNYENNPGYITENNIQIINFNDTLEQSIENIENIILLNKLKLLLNDKKDYQKLRDTIFTPYQGNYNIITKLKNNEEFTINMYLTYNSVKTDKEHNIQFSPVCATRTYCKLDYNKIIDVCGNKDLNDFIIEEGERYYKGILNQEERIHVLEYETIGFCSPLYILKQSLNELLIENLDNNLYHNISILKHFYNNTKNEFINIKDSLKVEKAIDIEIINGDDGIGYLLQTYLEYYDKKLNNTITYIGYRKIHPLINIILITIQFKDGFNQSYFNDLCKETYKNLSNLINELSEKIINL